MRRSAQTLDRPPERSPVEHASDEPLRTEFGFTLPRGYVDAAGSTHRDGMMRLATARDELLPLRDDRVRENPEYLTVVLLARVITRLGTITDVHAGIVENMFASDLAFLQDLYRRVNAEGHARAAMRCPACQAEFTVDLAGGRLGIVTRAPAELWAELTFMGYYLHWSLAELLDLEHPDRRRIAEHVQRLAERRE